MIQGNLAWVDLLLFVGGNKDVGSCMSWWISNAGLNKARGLQGWNELVTLKTRRQTMANPFEDNLMSAAFFPGRKTIMVPLMLAHLPS